MAFLGVAHVTEWAKIRLSFRILQKIPVFAFFFFVFHGVSFLKGDVQNGKRRGERGCRAWPRALGPRGLPEVLLIPPPSVQNAERMQLSLWKSRAVKGIRRGTKEKRDLTLERASFRTKNIPFVVQNTDFWLKKKQKRQSLCDPSLATPPSSPPHRTVPELWGLRVTLTPRPQGTNLGENRQFMIFFEDFFFWNKLIGDAKKGICLNCYRIPLPTAPSLPARCLRSSATSAEGEDSARMLSHPGCYPAREALKALLEMLFQFLARFYI